MKTPLLSFAILAAQLTTAVADSMPKLSGEKVCKARSADARMMKFAELQSVADCVSDENNAKQTLGSVWGATERAIRNRCQAETIALGMRSYVDLLTCIQTADDLKSQQSGSKSSSSPPPGR